MADAIDQLQFILDSVNLVREYREKSEVKNYVDQNFVYKNQRYVFENFNLLQKLAPEYQAQYAKIFGNKPLGKKKFWNQDDIRLKVDQFINYCYNSRTTLDRIEEQALNQFGQQYGISAHDLSRIRSNPNLLQLFKNKGKQKDLGSPTAGNINKELEKYKQTKGKEVKFVEKEHRASEYESKQKLDQLLQNQTPPETSSSGLVDAYGRPLSSARFEDLGQVPSATSQHPNGAEVLRAAGETPSNQQAHIPIRQKIGKATSQGRQILLPIAAEAGTQAEIALMRGESQATNFLIRSIGGVSRRIISLPFGGDAVSLNRTGSVLRAGVGVLRNAQRLARLAKNAGLLAKLGVVGGPAGAAVLACIAVFLIILIIPLLMQLMRSNAPCMPDGCPGKGSGESVPPSALIVTKEGPNEVANDSVISYKITVVYKGVGTAKVDLTDQIPADTKFSSASPSDTGVFEIKNPDSAQPTLVWHLNKLNFNEAAVVSFTVQPLKHDFWAVNIANASVTSTTGGSGRGLLCVPNLDSSLASFFEDAGAKVNVSPSLLYAIAVAENGGPSGVHPYSLAGQLHPISACAAHGLTQISHPHDETGKTFPQYVLSCAQVQGSNPATTNIYEIWGDLVSKYNTDSGGKLRSADGDEDVIWGTAYLVRNSIMNASSTMKGKGYLDPLTTNEINDVSTAYLGGVTGWYADLYRTAYTDAFSRQNTCGSTNVSTQTQPSE